MDQIPPPILPGSPLHMPSASAFTAPAVPVKGRTRFGLVMSLVIVGLLVVAGGTYAAAYFGYVTLPIPLPGLTSNIISKSLDGLYHTTASDTTTTMSLAVAPRDASIPPLFTLNTNSAENTNIPGLGTIATSPFESIPSNLSATLTGTSYSEKTSQLGKAQVRLQFHVTAGKTKSTGDVELRVIDTNIYLTIHEATGIPYVDVTNVKDKWYTMALPAAAVNAAANQSSTETANARQTIEQFLNLSQKYKLFTTKQNLGTEVIEGVSTKHTTHTLNAPQVLPFLQAWLKQRQQAKQDTAQFSDLIQQLQKPSNHGLLDRIAKALTVDLWYDGKTKTIKQERGTLVLVPPSSVTSLKSSQLVLTITTTIKSIGQKQAVEAPTNAQPLDTLFRNLTNISLPSAPTNQSTPSGTNANTNAPANINTNTTTNTSTNTNSGLTDSDSDGVPDVVEVYCGTNQHSTDSDGDGYSDVTEIENGYNPLGPGQATSTACKTFLDLYR